MDTPVFWQMLHVFVVIVYDLSHVRNGMLFTFENGIGQGDR